MDKIRLLLVDGNTEFFNDMKVTFVENNYIIHYAESGKECINKLLTEIVDVVLMHTDMKDLDVYDTAKLIRSNSQISHIPLIFITNQEESNVFLLKSYNSGATDVFCKPFVNDILIHKITTYHEMISNLRELENQVDVLTKLNDQNFAMRKQIEEIASIDYLTEIANRRVIDRELSNEYIIALQDKKPLALLMMDLDNFKMYNDYFGHQKGDKALRQIAKASKKVVNKTGDFVGRYGGEEFLFILTDCDEEQACVIANKIVQEINDLNIKHSPICERENITVSIGAVSCIPTSKVSAGKLITFADEALYDAKRQGKNRCFLKKI
jgi:diguanylate cyclase (GGDEF)-like protein